MKIYTKTGDAGETGLWGGLRIAKDAARVQAYGTVDECNAAIGVARAGGAAATIPRVGAEEITFLEQSIDALEGQLEPLKQFILPGGTPAAAQLHLARTICRRAERWVVGLARQEAALSAHIGMYLNRLS